MNVLNEVIKSFLGNKDVETSSEVEKSNILVPLGDTHDTTGIFFDDTTTVFGFSDKTGNVNAQKLKIQKYREMAMIPDVDEAIDIIVNEIIFSYDDSCPIALQTSLESESVSKVLNEKFNKIVKLMNLKRNIYQIVKRTYIDGQINIHCAYNKGNTRDGIVALNMIEPCGLVFDKSKNVWEYINQESALYGNNTETKFSPEELVHENFGLYHGDLILSYLEYAIKPSNMLKTLEDLLIPLRFSRSISRRVFNVDIGDLPTKRGAEVMQEHQRKFKYKKFYNNETGEVSNQQHITSMVEDYWFANRSGGKGTTVDLLDETGNLGELGDIVYLANKLYRALKIPSSRLVGNDSQFNDFDFDTSRTSREDLQFFMFVSRLRMVFSSVFKEILKREVISTKVMNEKEWEQIEDDISIVFKEDNSFIEKLNLANFTTRLEIYATAQEYSGKLFSVETILKEIFKLSDEEIKEESERIKKEEKDPNFARFYKKEDEDY